MKHIDQLLLGCTELSNTLQGWLLGALATVNLMFMGFLYSPEFALRPIKAAYRSVFPAKTKLQQVSRETSEASVSTCTDSSFSRSTSSGQDSLLTGLSDSELHQRAKECLEPPNKAHTAPVKAPSSKGTTVLSKKASPKKASPLKESPANGFPGPSTPRTLETDVAESQADMRKQIEALKAVAGQRDGLTADLEVLLLHADSLYLSQAISSMHQHAWFECCWTTATCLTWCFVSSTHAIVLSGCVVGVLQGILRSFHSCESVCSPKIRYDGIFEYM